MPARRSGAIVQFSSVDGQMWFAGFSAYSATKFAREGLSDALADEVKPFGVRVLIVEPGAPRTGLSVPSARALREIYLSIYASCAIGLVKNTRSNASSCLSAVSLLVSQPGYSAMCSASRG